MNGYVIEVVDGNGDVERWAGHRRVVWARWEAEEFVTEAAARAALGRPELRGLRTRVACARIGSVAS